MTRSGRLALMGVLIIVIGGAASFVLRGKAPPGAPGTVSGAARAPAAAAAPAAPASAPPIELSETDIARVRHTELQTSINISGGLRAVNSAMVRAKVAAEVKEVAVREGDRVAAGQLIVRLDDTEYQWRLRQAEDQATAAKAQLEIAERTLANNRALVDQGFISKNALDTSLMSAEGARASMMAARAAAEIARKAVNDSVLRAPLAGIVSQRLVQPGERVGVDARLIEVVDLARIELEAAVAPEDVATIRVGQSATLQVDGSPDRMSASVVRINPSTQAGTRAVMVYLALAPHPALRQGLFARGGIETQRRRALVVPAGAVRLDQARPYVLVAEGARVRQVSVTLGASGSTAGVPGADGPAEPVSEVSQGLAEGALVLRGSVGALRDGALVKLPAALGSVAAAPAAVAPAASAATR